MGMDLGVGSGLGINTLTHHHMSNKFDMVSQGTKTIQEVLNNIKKYAAWMIHLPDIYMFCKWFVLTLHADNACIQCTKT